MSWNIDDTPYPGPPDDCIAASVVVYASDGSVLFSSDDREQASAFLAAGAKAGKNYYQSSVEWREK